MTKETGALGAIQRQIMWNRRAVDFIGSFTVLP
jgi:hypothetical protein